MPNICNYSMRVQGKPNDVEEVIKTVQSDYSYPEMKFDHDKHLFRIFDASIDDDDEDEGIRSVIINGDCAWSVATCMTENGYYAGLKEEYGDKFRGTTLAELTKNTSTMIDVFSEETGLCFQEHYLYKNGECIIEDCVPYYELYKDDLEDEDMTIEEMLDKINEDENLDFTMEDVYNDGDLYMIGGFKDWDFESWDM